MDISILINIMEEWLELIPPSDLRERLQVPKLVERKTNAIYGLRRVGKTYLSFQIASNLNDFVYINLEDERIPRKKEVLTKLIPAASAVAKSEKFWLIVDEIQTIPEWDRWVNRVTESRQVNLLITGSTHVLSKYYLPRVLRGRVKGYRLFPLTFREFMSFKGMSIGKTQIKVGKIISALEEYLEFGGMPTVVLEEEKIDKINEGRELFDAIFFRDLIERFEIKNAKVMRDMLRITINSKQVTISKMYRNLVGLGYKIGKGTISEYLEYPKYIFLYELVEIFGKSVKDVLRYPRKVYFADNIFYRIFLSRLNKTWLLENLVYWELRRRFPEFEIRYWKSYEGYEVDFVLIKDNKVKQLIQVAYSFEDKKTMRREERALLKANKELGCDYLLILTWEEERKTERNGKKIIYKPVWKWLLEA